MTSAIMNPTRPQEIEAIRAANLLNNNDPHGYEWIKANRSNSDKSNVHDANENTENRRARRRRRK